MRATTDKWVWNTNCSARRLRSVQLNRLSKGRIPRRNFFFIFVQNISRLLPRSVEFQLWRRKKILRVKSSCCASSVRWWLCGRVQARSADPAQLAESTFDQIAALHTLTRGLVKSEEEKISSIFPLAPLPHHRTESANTQQVQSRDSRVWCCCWAASSSEPVDDNSQSDAVVRMRPASNELNFKPLIISITSFFLSLSLSSLFQLQFFSPLCASFSRRTATTAAAQKKLRRKTRD